MGHWAGNASQLKVTGVCVDGCKFGEMYSEGACAYRRAGWRGIAEARGGGGWRSSGETGRPRFVGLSCSVVQRDTARGHYLSSVLDSIGAHAANGRLDRGSLPVRVDFIIAL